MTRTLSSFAVVVAVSLGMGQAALAEETEKQNPFKAVQGWQADEPPKTEATEAAEPDKSAAAPTKTRLAVMDVEITGGNLDEVVSRSITSVIAAELHARAGERYTVISSNELRGVIAQQIQIQETGCDTPDCFIDVGKMAKADQLVTTTIALVGEEWVFTLQLIDADAGGVLARQAVSWKGGASGLVDLCRPLVTRLLDPSGAENYAGSLQILANEDEAEVHVDDQKIGPTPLAIVGELPIGKHRVRIRKSGYLPVEQDVVVNRNETTLFQIQMIDKASLQPWYYKWWIWAAVGGVVAGGIAAAAIGSTSGGSPTTLVVTAPVPGASQ